MNMKYAMRSEDTEQINVVSWANWNMNRYPELRWLFHVPNGGSRNKQEAVKFKQMGVKAGVSDLCLPYPKGLYCGLYIEMKFGDNRQQETQKEFLECRWLPTLLPTLVEGMRICWKKMKYAHGKRGHGDDRMVFVGPIVTSTNS